MVTKVKNNYLRIQKIRQNIPDRFFYEKIFDTSFRNKILSDIPLDYSKVDYNNMLTCSPLLNREQEYHIFRKYNYLKYRLIKLTIGFQKTKIKPYPKPAKPVNLDKLGNKSLSEIEDIISRLQNIRNLLLESNLRLIVKNISRYCPTDSFDRDEFFSHGYFHILKSIECFDYRKGFKFSTYCVNVLKTNLYRDYQTIRKHSERFTLPEELEASDHREPDYSEINQKYNRKIISEMFCEMKKDIKNADIRIKVVKDYYGLEGDKKNLYELGDELNLSKERIRQIKLDALKYLSKKAKELSYDPLV